MQTDSFNATVQR